MRTLVPIACFTGGLLLVGSELLHTFVIENLEGEAVDRVGAAGRHFFALGLLGLLGAAAAIAATVTRSRPPAIAVIVAGTAALAILALADLSDLGSRDLVANPNDDLVEGRVVAAGGLWTSLAGATTMTFGGVLLALMNARPGRDRDGEAHQR